MHRSADKYGPEAAARVVVMATLPARLAAPPETMSVDPQLNPYHPNLLCEGLRGRGRRIEGESERERESEREADRQRDRPTDRHTYRQTENERERERETN